MCLRLIELEDMPDEGGNDVHHTRRAHRPLGQGLRHQAVASIGDLVVVALRPGRINFLSGSGWRSHGFGARAQRDLRVERPPETFPDMKRQRRG